MRSLCCSPNAFAFDPFDPPYYSGNRLWSFNGSRVDFPIDDDDYRPTPSLNYSDTVVHWAGSVTYGEAVCNIETFLRRYGNASIPVTAIVTYDRLVPAGFNRLGWRSWVDGEIARNDGDLLWKVWVVNLARRSPIFTKERTGIGIGDYPNVAGWRQTDIPVDPGDAIRFAMMIRAYTNSTSWAWFQARLVFSTCYWVGDSCS